MWLLTFVVGVVRRCVRAGACAAGARPRRRCVVAPPARAMSWTRGVSLPRAKTPSCGQGLEALLPVCLPRLRGRGSGARDVWRRACRAAWLLVEQAHHAARAQLLE